MKRLCSISLLLIMFSSLFAEGGAFDLLYQNHSAHSTAYKMQDYTGKTLEEILLETGYIKDSSLGYIYELPNGKMFVECQVNNGVVQTTIKCVTNDESEQLSLCNYVITDFIQTLQRNPVESIAGVAYEWKNTAYGDARVMMFNRYVTFSLTDILKEN